MSKGSQVTLSGVEIVYHILNNRHLGQIFNPSIVNNAWAGILSSLRDMWKKFDPYSVLKQV